MNEPTPLRRLAGDRRFPWRIVLLLALLLATLRVAYVLGYRAAGETPPEQYDGRITDPGRAEKLEIERLRAELDVERKRHELDERALEMLRSELAAENRSQAKLEEEVKFYRSLMAPGSVQNGVSLLAPQLVAAADGERVAFRILVQQQANKHSMVKGKLTVSLRGELAGQEVFYPLSELSDAIESASIELRFRYFQALEGELTIPDGFVPQAVEISAALTQPKKLTIQDAFEWQLQERFTHVGS